MNKKILLLTDVAPTKQKTGGIVLDQLCRFLPKGTLACYCVVDRLKYSTISPDLDWIPVEYYRRFNEYFRTFIPSFFSKIIDDCYLRLLTKKIVAFAQKNNIGVVWCVLEGLTMIRLARSVTDVLNVPLLTQVWDPPEWWLRVRKIKPVYRDMILREFEMVLRKSACCATASWAMAEEYHQLYNITTVPFLPSLDKNLVLPPVQENRNNSMITLALAGQIYAKDAWKALINALDSCHWKINNKPVKIILVGRHQVQSRPNIEIVGWQTQSETIRILSNADILYCPYWFDREYEKEVRLSFPSKLTTYFAAGRPVIFHGPSYASVGKFLDKTAAGLCIYSLEKESIIEGISKLLSNRNEYWHLTQNSQKTFNQFFTLVSLENNFKQFIEKSNIKL